MKINKDIVHSLNPCSDGYDWYLKHGSEDLLDTLLTVNKEYSEWASWLYTHLMTVRQRRQIAIFAAEQVIDIFEKKYPDDTRPRTAIDAAKMVLLEDTGENRERARIAYAASASAYAAAYAAANAAAYAAAYAAANAAAYAYAYAYAASAYAATYAANAATYATYAAANAADAATYAANAAANAAYAYAAANAANAARVQMQETIIREAVRILDSA